MVSSLFLYEHVETTQAKAKILKQEAQRVVNKINTSEDTLALRRYLEGYLYGGSVEKAIETKGDFSGVTLVRTSERLGDGTMKTLVNLIRVEAKRPKTEKKGDSKKE